MVDGWKKRGKNTENGQLSDFSAPYSYSKE